MSRRASLAFALALLGCAAPEPPAKRPSPPVAPQWTPIAVTARTVALGEASLGRRLGAVRYLGGLELAGAGVRLHGLSDLRVSADGAILAVSDDGDLIRGELRSDALGRPLSIDRAEIRPLTGLDGASLPPDKAQVDAEGLARLPDGRLLVSFERAHRIWLYDGEGRPPRPAPAPTAVMPPNEGLEALTDWPAKGADAYLVGGEEGATWLCRLSAGCAPTGAPRLAAGGYGLVGFAPLAGDRVLALLRAWDPIRGARVKVMLVAAAGSPKARSRELFRLARPATVDNFEGISAVPQPGGGWRIYLLSDDNFSAAQRTLLLAFAWSGT